MFDLRPILLVVGILLTTLGCAMLVPAIFDLALNDPDWVVFAASAGFTLFVGISLALVTWGRTEYLSVKQAFVLTNVSWVALAGFAALPIALADIDLNYTDAFFEAMSGLTTTGATVIVGLDEAPPGLLLWRGLLQWLGGIGIIVMAIAVLPMLQVGGMQLFRMESSDTSEKILPRATQIAGSITIIYISLTAACALSYLFAGMDPFDALVHAM
ncbi:MAG: potassium transporter TrkG, partial [Hyphomicrobiales bacterium]